MFETYYLTVCSVGKNPNLVECLRNLLEIKEIASENVEVLVVINQEKVNQTFDSRVHVYFEPLMGYSNVRNKAISVVPENTNLIFLDDDEIPNINWFNELISMHIKYPHDVIFGPVYSNMEAQSYRNQFKNKYSKLMDGAIVNQAGAGNMLIPSILLDQGLIHFDEIYNLSGSEDTDLCFRLRKLGIKIRFAKKASLFEIERPERFHIKYIEERRIRDIANYSLVIRRNSPGVMILWRFTTLLSRIFFFSVLSLVKSRYKAKSAAYFYSMKVLITGRHKAL